MYRLFLIAAITLAPLFLRAQGKNVSVAPAPGWLAPYQPDMNRKVNAKDFSDGYYLQVFEEQYHAEKQTIYRHIVRQIESEAGIQNGSEINVDYSPEYEKLQFHQILVRRNGKVINQLNISSIKVLQQEQDLSMFIYSGRYNAYCIVEDVRKGDQIEYAYSIIGDNPIFAGKYSQTYYLTAYEPIANYYKALIVHPSRPLHLKYYNNAPKAIKRSLNGMDLYEWDLGAGIYHLKPEDYQPSWYTGYPYVDVSEFANWAEVIQWGASVTNNIPLNGREVLDRVSQLKARAGGDTARYMESAIRFVQDDIRYMGIEIGEYSHRPNTPEKVCKQRFGDCKDKALLLIALLRGYGIEAHMAYVHTGFRGRVAERLPSPDRFNHAIVKARFRETDYWIDATASYQRGRLANRYNPAFKKGLVIKDGNTALSDIPLRNTGSSEVTEVFKIAGLENDSAILNVTSVYKGQYADDLRSVFANSSISEMEKSYTEFYGKNYGKVELRDSMVIRDNDSLNEIVVEEMYTIREPWTIDSAKNLKQSFSTTALALSSRIIFVDKGRKTPVKLEFPLNLKYHIKIEFPVNWSVENEVVDQKRPFYNFAAKAAVFENIVQLNYAFESKSDHIPEEALTQYRLDMEELNKVAGYSFTWTPGAKDLAKKHSENTGSNGLNWLMVGIALASAAIFSYLCLLYNKRSLPSSYPPREPWEISSWLILLAIGAVISPVGLLVAVCKIDSFQSSIWASLPAAFPDKNIILVQLFLVMEVIVNICTLVMTVFSAVLFFRKRDIFPRTFCFILIFNLVTLLADFLVADIYLGASNFSENGGELVSPLFSMAIWVPAMLISDRVKQTFVVPYEMA